jgi:hypothetical protein
VVALIELLVKRFLKIQCRFRLEERFGTHFPII